MSYVSMIFMLLIFVTIFFGSHLFVYFSLVKFLSITSTNGKLLLAGLLFVLAISFIASSIWSHFSDNAFTRMLYFLSSLWMGIGLNLIIALVVSWTVIGISKVLNFQFEHKYLVIFSVIFMVVYSAYGVWNAYHPQIKNITVKIKNLPEAWKGKTAIQLSDVHLGHVFGADFLTRVVQQVNAENPDIVFITGDLFDGMDGNLSTLVGPLQNMKAKDGTYFVTGNHETYLGVNNALAVLEKTPVKILDDAKVNIDGMQIVGVSYPNRGISKNIAEVIKNMTGFDANNPSILLYHNPDRAVQAQASGVSLQLAGHTHDGQLFPINFIPRLIYGKYSLGLNVDGDFSIYTSSGVGTWGPTMRTSAAPEIVVIHFEKN